MDSQAAFEESIGIGTYRQVPKGVEAGDGF